MTATALTGGKALNLVGKLMLTLHQSGYRLKAYHNPFAFTWGECLESRMSRILVPSVLAAAVASLLITTVQASDALPVIVVTAGKAPENISQVPARISVISEKTLGQSSVTSLPQVLQQEAALNIVQSGGYGQQTSIFTRGSNSNHTLVLKDGVRTNTGSTSAANINFFDLSNVSRVEVLKGPASVQYGSDAVGGVIQLISEAPKQQKFFTTLEGGELDTYKAIIGADLVQNDVYLQMRCQRLETDGSPVTDTPKAKDASYDQKGFSVKGGIEKQYYAASAQIEQNSGNSDYNPMLTGNQDFKNHTLNLKGRFNVNNDLSLNGRFSNFKDELTQTKSVGHFDTDTKEADVSARWNFVANQNVLLGLTTRKTEVDTTSYKNKELQTNGYYVQHQYQVNDVSTQAGVRVEDDDNFGTHTVGQLAGRMQLAAQTSVYANIGTAFHAPTANDLYGFGGNIDLDPEESVSYELGLDQQLAQGLNAYVSVYQTKIKNLISAECVAVCDGDWVKTFPVYQNININKAKLTGGEVGLKLNHDNWFSTLEYAYVQPKNDITDAELTRRPRQTATLTSGWSNKVYGGSFSIVAKSDAKDFAPKSPTPGFVTANINGFYQVNPNVRLFANVQNLGDKTYKTALYNTPPTGAQYYIAAPRLATAGVTLSY